MVSLLVTTLFKEGEFPWERQEINFSAPLRESQIQVVPTSEIANAPNSLIIYIVNCLRPTDCFLCLHTPK